MQPRLLRDEIIKWLESDGGELWSRRRHRIAFGEGAGSCPLIASVVDDGLRRVPDESGLWTGAWRSHYMPADNLKWYHCDEWRPDLPPEYTGEVIIRDRVDSKPG